MGFPLLVIARAGRMRFFAMPPYTLRPRRAARARGKSPEIRRRPALETCEERVVPSGSALYINSINVVRNSASTQIAEFTVSLIPPNLQQQVTVDFATSDGTALAGQEYQAQSGVLTFNPTDPSNTQVIDITLTNPTSGTDLSLTKTFTVTLSNPVNAAIGRATGTATIDYSNAAGVFTFSGSTYNTTSQSGSATITVNRLDGGAAGMSVGYATSDGTAVAGVNYQTASGRLPFAANQTTATFAVPILDAGAISGSETVNLALSVPSEPAQLGNPTSAVLTIQNVGSTVVVNTNDSGRGSLRQAMLVSQTLASPGTILFDIPGPGPFVIEPLSPLPQLNLPVTIAGESQPGYSGIPLIEVNGAKAGAGTDGFDLNGGASVIQGLAIGGFSGSGVVLSGPGGDLIASNDLGATPGGLGPLGNGGDGVAIVNSPNNTVGGTSSSARNVISANAFEGVEITGNGATGNLIEGNFIGVSGDGGSPLGNGYDGVFVNGASGNQIGSSAAGAGNVISANKAEGVQIDAGSGNTIQGNRIGVDATGSRALGNGYDGVWLDNSSNNLVGGAQAGAGNVISGNKLAGVRISGSGGSGNLVLGNLIGVNASGTAVIDNTYDGIFIIGAPGNTIGGPAGGRNVISGNGASGIQIFGTTASGNVVQFNLIGADITGLRALGNRYDGVFLNNAPGNTIGGLSGQGNVISGNGQVGVQIYQLGARGNVIVGNLIGTDILGRPDLGNAYGVFVNGAGPNTIALASAGGKVAGNRNANATVGPRSAGPLVTHIYTITEVGSTNISGIQVLFNQPLNAASADRPGNYLLRRLHGDRGGRLLPFARAAYDPSSLSVTLTNGKPLVAGPRYRFSVNGGLDRGVTSVKGVHLDGDRNNLPGGNFIAVIHN